MLAKKNLFAPLARHPSRPWRKSSLLRHALNTRPPRGGWGMNNSIPPAADSQAQMVKEGFSKKT
jgi:hypothetical protein